MNLKCSVCLLSALLATTPAFPATYTTQKEEPVKTITNQWNGRHVAFLGDSITDPNNRSASKHYWEFLAEWLGIHPHVYAKSGHQWDDIYHQAERLKAEGTEVDAILIFAGTNDYNAGVPLGPWYDYKPVETTVKGGGREVRLQRTPQQTDQTFCGRINRVMDYLKTNFPDKQIIVLTPLHRGAARFSGNNIQPEESFPNRLGLYIDDYIKEVKETSTVWAVPVIDLSSLSGLYPTNDAHARYFHNRDTDRLHPNTEGQRRMALTLMYQLLALPGGFQL